MVKDLLMFVRDILSGDDTSSIAVVWSRGLLNLTLGLTSAIIAVGLLGLVKEGGAPGSVFVSLAVTSMVALVFICLGLTILFNREHLLSEHEE